MVINYEKDPPIDESRPTDNDAQFPNINEVAKDDEVAYHAFIKRVDIESNEYEDDAIGSRGGKRVELPFRPGLLMPPTKMGPATVAHLYPGHVLVCPARPSTG